MLNPSSDLIRGLCVLFVFGGVSFKALAEDALASCKNPIHNEADLENQTASLPATLQTLPIHLTFRYSMGLAHAAMRLWSYKPTPESKGILKLRVNAYAPIADIDVYDEYEIQEACFEQENFTVKFTNGVVQVMKFKKNSKGEEKIIYDRADFKKVSPDDYDQFVRDNLSNFNKRKSKPPPEGRGTQ